MDFTEVMRELETCGTEQNRTVYGRHGVRGAMFGVSFENLSRLAKQIGKDQVLADALWNSANHDARVLATMVADPGRLSTMQAESWVVDLDNYVLTDAVSKLFAQAPQLVGEIERWSASATDWIGQLGWNLIAALAGAKNGRSDEFFLAKLAEIERTIHSRANRTRHAMNAALICIGSRNAVLQRAALEAAARIGKVVVDHGETNCTTPDAAGYIQKMVARQAAAASKPAAAAAPPPARVAKPAPAAAPAKVARPAAKPMKAKAKKKAAKPRGAKKAKKAAKRPRPKAKKKTAKARRPKAKRKAARSPHGKAKKKAARAPRRKAKKRPAGRRR